MAAKEIYDGIPAAMSTKMAHENKLVLKASFRPMMSAENPQPAAPTRRPICEASGIPATFLLG